MANSLIIPALKRILSSLCFVMTHNCHAHLGLLYHGCMDFLSKFSRFLSLAFPTRLRLVRDAQCTWQVSSLPTRNSMHTDPG